jgi:hypothetical protein
MRRSFKPQPAESVGLITNYCCTFKCKHCLYCSSPEIKEDIDQSALFEIIDQINYALGGVLLHIGGGEPLIHFQLTKDIIAYLRGTKIIVEYLETNGSPIITRTTEKLKDLKASGLDCVLISISPFHNEFISLSHVKRIIQEIVSVFGRQGIFPWHPGYLSYLEKTSEQAPLPLDKHFDAFSVLEILQQLRSVMYIHPGGRGAYMLAQYLPLQPAEELLDKTCSQNLGSPVHAHIDFKGNYLAGFCSGLRIGKHSGLNLNRLYNEGIKLDRYPVLDQLINGGLNALYKTALSSGFTPEPKGYVSSCHLCLDLRIYLFSQGEAYEELYPTFFYKDLLKQKNKF